MKKIILITAVLLTLPFIMTPALADQTKDGQASSRERAQSLLDQGLALGNNSLEEAQFYRRAIEIQEALPTEERDSDLRDQQVQLLELESRINRLFKPNMRGYCSSEQIVQALSRRITRGGQKIYEGPRQPLLFFNTGSAKLTKRNERQLRALANALQSPELIADHFAIEGHADGRGSAASNLALSKRRAETVRDWLIRYGNIKPGRLSMAFYGEDHPIFPNNSPDHYRYNRRIEIVRRYIQ